MAGSEKQVLTDIFYVLKGYDYLKEADRKEFLEILLTGKREGWDLDAPHVLGARSR